MKTSVAKKLKNRVLAAFMAIAVMLSCVVPSAITASAAEDVNIDGTSHVNVTGSNLQLQDEQGNWVSVNEYGSVNFGKTGVRFQFDWTLDQDFVDKLVKGDIKVPVTLEVDLSKQLHDINITTQGENSVTNNKGLTGSYRFDGQKVYITINSISKDEEQSGNTQHYGGGGLVMGELDIKEEEIPSNGEVEVQFFEKTYKAVYTPKTGKMYVQKNFSKTHYDTETSAYYADFSVNVGSWTEDLKDLKLTDTFQYGDDCFYADDVIHNVTVTTPDGKTHTLGDKHSGDKFELGSDITLKKGEQATVTYSIKIDPEKQDDYNKKANNVEATADNDSKSAKGSAYGSAEMPSADKSGSMAEGSDTIKWTIRVYLNILGSEGVPEESKTFTVSDTPDSNIAAAFDGLEGVTKNSDGSYNIPKSLFTDKGNGVYEYTYETKLEDSVLSSPADTQVKNHITVEFPKIVKDRYTVDKDGELTVKGVGVGAIDKELVEMLSGGRISWKVNVTLPDADTTKLKLTDTTKNWDMRYLNHTVLLNTLKINGSSYSEACKKREWHNDGEDEYCSVLYDGSIEFELSPEFLSKHKGEKVTITYQTQAVDASGNKITNIDPTMYIYNKAQFELELDGEKTPIVKYDEYTKVPQFAVSKTAEYEWSVHDIFDLTDLAHPLLWSIKIDGLNSVDDTLEVGDTFTVVDTLPKYFEVDQYVWGAANGNYGNASYYQVGKDITVSQEKGSRQAVFTITVSKEMLAKLKEQAGSDGKWHLWLTYSTYVSKEYEQEFQMDYYRPNESGTSSVTVRNTADVSFNDELVASDVTANQNITIENPKILNKSILKKAVDESGNIIAEEEEVNGETKYFITYEVKINENAEIIGDTDENGKPLLKELEAVDNLGYGMTFGGVISGIENDRVKVSKNKQKVTFELENQKKYDIVYKVYVDRAQLNENVEDAEQRFGNVISLTGSNNATARNTVHMSSSAYRSKFYIYADSDLKYLTVKGTKIWENMDGYTQPKEITLQLTKKNSDTGAVVGEPITYKIGTGDDCDIYCIIEDDQWTFTIPKLVTYDGVNHYKYDIEEINIDGYSVEYEGGHTDLTNNSPDENNIIEVVPLTITNIHLETVNVSGTKTWVDNSDKEKKRPKTLKIHLYANGKLYDEQSISGIGDVWTYEFTDLPKFDADGNEIEYTVDEGTTAGYAGQQVGKYDFVNRLKTSKVKVQKVDENGDPLKGARLQLWDKAGMLDEWTTNGEPHEMNVVSGEKYTLKEKEAPKGYELADDMEFTAPTEGTVTWTMIDKKTPEKPKEKPKASILKVDEDGKPLAGAELAVLCDGKEVTSWTTDGKAKEIELEAGKDYILRELDAPEGYEKAADVKFTAPAAGETVEVKMTDKKKQQEPEKPKPTKVEISKKDITNGEELPGAKLKVVDKNGKVIKEWVSTDKPTYFEDVFEAGETYTLIEETAPDGYLIAEEVKFTVKADGTLTTVEMFDSKKPQETEETKPTKVEISKKDITNGEELPGAKLKVVDKNGKVIKEWVSTDKPTYFEDVFEAGETYTLIEETAPDGYLIAEEVKFTVKADGTLTTVEMFDSKKPQETEETKPTKVEISKKDITNGEELPGAKLKVVDKNGKVIKEWVSTDKPTYFEDVFEAGETYTLIEETAPDGYLTAEEVKFTVKADGTLTVVEMFDDVKKGTDTDNDTNDRDTGVAQGGGSNDRGDDSPKTGSSCNVTLVMLALALGVMAVTNKKRRNN